MTRIATKAARSSSTANRPAVVNIRTETGLDFGGRSGCGRAGGTTTTCALSNQWRAEAGH